MWDGNHYRCTGCGEVYGNNGFAVAQDGNFYISGADGTGKSVVMERFVSYENDAL